MGARVATDHDARVVRHVEPLVGIGGPRVGSRETRHAILERGHGRGPQTERAVDVQPGIRARSDHVHDLG